MDARQQLGLTLYAGALCLVIACARRNSMRAHCPEPEAMDSLAIRRLPWPKTFENYYAASYLAGTRTALADRIRYTSIAHASLQAFFDGIEAHPNIQQGFRSDKGAWLDQASDGWKARRRVKP